MNTTENNNIIAEFLGSQYINKPYTDIEGIINDFWHWTKPNCKIPHSIGIGELTTAWTIGNFHFHDDWNWLMEVVEKIYTIDLYYDKYIEFNSSIFSNGKIELSTRIDLVYNQCVEFIKWYNEQKK